MVLARDKVIREMLATCARSMGLSVHASGAARAAVQSLGQKKFRYQMVLVGPELEDADATRVAIALGRNPSCQRVLGFGLKTTKQTVELFEPRSFPIDFVELFVELRKSCLEESLIGIPSEEGAEEGLAQVA
jgi:CheY-like chemotaxis protein